MISGFLIMLRYADTLLKERGAWRRFILRRITRLYPLYLATLLFFVLMGIAIHSGLGESHWPGRYDWSTLPENILLMQAWGLTDNLTFNYVAWTLSAEWFCYLAFPLIVLVSTRWGMGGLAALTAGTIVLLELATAQGIIPFDSWLLADTWGAYRAFADFCIGALVALAVRASPAVPARHGHAWFVMGLAVVAMQTDQNSYFILLLLALSIYLAALAEAATSAGFRLAEAARATRQGVLRHLPHPPGHRDDLLLDRLEDGSGRAGDRLLRLLADPDHAVDRRGARVRPLFRRPDGQMAQRHLRPSQGAACRTRLIDDPSGHCAMNREIAHWTAAAAVARALRSSK